MTDKIKASHPQGKQPAERQRGGPTKPLRKRDEYKPLWIEVRFRGGPEASWLISARGVTYRFPGHLSLHDALAEVAF